MGIKLSDAELASAVELTEEDLAAAVEVPDEAPAAAPPLDMQAQWKARLPEVRRAEQLQTPVPVEPTLLERMQRAGERGGRAPDKEPGLLNAAERAVYAAGAVVPPLRGLHALNAAKAEVLDPLVVRPFNEYMAEQFDTSLPGQALKVGGAFQLMQLGVAPDKAEALAEFALRQGGTLLMGDTLGVGGGPSKMDERKMRKALEGLHDVVKVVDTLSGQDKLARMLGAEQYLGTEVSAAFAQSLLDGLGKLPLMFLPVPGLTPALRGVMATERVGTAAVAGKTVAAGMLGAAENVAGDLFVDKANLTQSALAGGAIGGGLGGVAAKGADVLANRRMDAELDASMVERKPYAPPSMRSKNKLAEYKAAESSPPPRTPDEQALVEAQVTASADAPRRKPAPTSERVIGVLSKDLREDAGVQALRLADEGVVKNPTFAVSAVEDGKPIAYQVEVLQSGQMVKQQIPLSKLAKLDVSVLRITPDAPAPVAATAAKPVDPNSTKAAAPRGVSQPKQNTTNVLTALVDDVNFHLDRDAVVDSHGMVVLGPTGAARIIDVNSVEARRAILRHTKIVEVKVGGETKLAKLLTLSGDAGKDNTNVVVVPVEGHPNSIPSVLPLDGKAASIAKETANFTEAQLTEIANEIVQAEGGNHLPVSEASAPDAAPAGGAPPPVPPVVTAAATPAPSPRAVPHQVQAAQNIVRNLKPNMLTQLLRKILPVQMWAGPELGRFAVSARASENLSEMGPRFAAFVEGSFNLTPQRRIELGKSLYKMFNGQMTEADLAQAFPEVSASAEAVATRYRLMLNNNHARIKALGGELRETVDLDQVDQAVTTVKRQFYKHLLGGELNAARVKRSTGLYDKAIKEVEAEYYANDKSLSPEEKRLLATHMVDAIIGQPNSASALTELRNRTAGTNKAESSFRRRADLRPVVDLMHQDWKGTPFEKYSNVLQDAKKKGLDIKPIAKQLLQLLDAKGVTGPFYKAVFELSQMDELSSTFRQLLGELDDGFWAAGTTLAHQEAKIAELTTWKLLSESKNTLFDGAYTRDAHVVAANPEGWVYLDPDYKHKVGNAAGGWVREDFWAAMGDTQQLAQQQLGAVKKILALQRMGMTALSAGAAFTQGLSNSFGMMLSGGFRAFRPDKSLVTIGQAWQDFSAFRKDPLSGKAGVKLFKRAVELGITSSQFGADEHRILRNEFMNTQVKLANTGVKIPWSEQSVYMAKWAASKGVKATSALTAAYQIADPAMKYAAWRGLLEQGGVVVRGDKVMIDRAKAEQFIDSSYSPGMSDNALVDFVQREAARRVAASFAMFNMLSPAQKAVGQSAGLISDLFVTSFTEGMRTVGQIPLRLAQRESGFASNLLQWMTVTGGVLAGVYAMKRANGISEAQEDYARKRLSPSDQQYHPFAMAVPWTDANGEVMFMDLASRLIQPLSALNGYEELGPTKAFVGAWLQQLLGGVVSDQLGITKLLAAYGFAPDPIEPKMDKAQYDAWQWLNGLIDQGLPSTGLRAIAKTVRQAGWSSTPPNQFQGQYTTGVGAANLLTGNAVMTPLSQKNALELAKIREGKAQQELDNAKRLNENASKGLFSIDKDRAVQQAADTLTKRKEERKGLYR